MGIPDFESSAFGHSANLPLTFYVSQNGKDALNFNGCKDNIIFSYSKEKSHSNESFSSFAFNISASDFLIPNFISQVLS